MSDVTVAPPSAPANTPAPAPAPAANETPINQNPTNIPAPVGSQAPERVGGDRPAPSRRDAVKAAFDRATKMQDAGEKAAPRRAQAAEKAPEADAKPGHNQPPEDTPKLDLKKRPADQEQPQPRDRGRFAAKPRDAVTNEAPDVATNRAGNVAPGQQPGQQPAAPPAKQLPDHAPFPKPLARMAESAKRDWAATPETVRGDVHRMHSEFSKAADYYKGIHEAFKPIERYHRMAQEHGTTLEKALDNYTSMESKLREDPVAGLDVIVNNLGLRTPDGQAIGLRDIAYHVLSQSPEQLRQLQMGNQQSAASQQIGALHQEIAGLKSVLQEMHTRQQFTYTRSAVDQFADSHPRFDELGAAIEQELKLGFDLDTAYRRAELLRPAAHAPQTRTTPAQTRPADKSIAGAPDVAPSNGASRPKTPSRTPRDAVQKAIQQLGRAH